MPYKDPAKQREAKRAWKARNRVPGGNQGRPLLPLAVRLEGVRDVLVLVHGQVLALLNDRHLTTVDRARAVGYLLGIALRCCELGDLASRLEALEQLLDGGEHALVEN